MTFEQAVAALQQAKERNANRELGVLTILRETNQTAFDEIIEWCRELETDRFKSEQILAAILRGQRAMFDAAMQEFFDEAQRWEITRERLAELQSDPNTAVPFGMPW